MEGATGLGAAGPPPFVLRAGPENLARDQARRILQRRPGLVTFPPTVRPLRPLYHQVRHRLRRPVRRPPVGWLA